MISAEEFKHYSTLGSPGETPDHEMVISIQEQFEHLDANRDGTLDPTEIRIWAAPGIHYLALGTAFVFVLYSLHVIGNLLNVNGFH